MQMRIVLCGIIILLAAFAVICTNISARAIVLVTILGCCAVYVYITEQTICQLSKDGFPQILTVHPDAPQSVPVRMIEQRKLHQVDNEPAPDARVARLYEHTQPTAQPKEQTAQPQSGRLPALNEPMPIMQQVAADTNMRAFIGAGQRPTHARDTMENMINTHASAYFRTPHTMQRR